MLHCWWDSDCMIFPLEPKYSFCVAMTPHPQNLERRSLSILNMMPFAKGLPAFKISAQNTCLFWMNFSITTHTSSRSRSLIASTVDEFFCDRNVGHSSSIWQDRHLKIVTMLGFNPAVKTSPESLVVAGKFTLFNWTLHKTATNRSWSHMPSPPAHHSLRLHLKIRHARRSQTNVQISALGWAGGFDQTHFVMRPIALPAVLAEESSLLVVTRVQIRAGSTTKAPPFRFSD